MDPLSCCSQDAPGANLTESLCFTSKVFNCSRFYSNFTCRFDFDTREIEYLVDMDDPILTFWSNAECVFTPTAQFPADITPNGERGIIGSPLAVSYSYSPPVYGSNCSLELLPNLRVQ